MEIGIKVEASRNPIKLELVRHVLPLLGLWAFLAGLFGYHRAWKACEYGIFR
jgi:hypothetical protein